MSSISRTPQGRWRARYRDPGGRSRSRTFDTKVEARRFLDATGTDMHRGEWVDPAAGRLTLAERAATYLATVTNLRPTTLATYERDLTRYVLPASGTCRSPASGHSTSGPGWPTSSPPASLPRPSTATSARCAGCCGWRSRATCW